MGLAFIPLYIQYLGIESYGLIGLFAILQTLTSIIDMGMGSALVREMARYTAGAITVQTIRNLLRSVEIVFFILSILIGIIIWFSSKWLATSWMQVDKLSTTLVSEALSITAVVLALRFCEGIYRNTLIGLQKQVIFNIANVVLATMRHAGVLGILAFVSPTIQAFFLWHAFCSLITIVVLSGITYYLLPEKQYKSHFSISALRGIKQFAGGMMANTILVILLTQIDKVLLSRLLTLEEFAYYTLASTISLILYLLVVPVSQSVYPSMVEFVSQKNETGLSSLYHRSAQLVTLLTGPIAIVLIFFPEGVVYTWTGDINIALRVSPILSILALGFFLNCFMQIPFYTQIANNWTALSLKTNLIAVILLIPSTMYIVPLYGAIGAAWIWVVLNIGFITIVISLMHRKLIPKEKWAWYIFDIFLPVIGIVITAILVRQFQPIDYNNRTEWFLYLVVVSLFGNIVVVLLAKHVREKVIIIALKILNIILPTSLRKPFNG